MIKFWKEDFKYIKRSPYTHFFVEGFGYVYTFSVRGESANYLMNKYNLNYPYIKVCVNYGHNSASMRVVGETEDKSQFGACDICGEDLAELVSLLKADIEIDLKNYEEYVCDDWYRKDSRWS